MRTKLGLAVATMTTASVLAFGLPAAATPTTETTPTTVADAPPATSTTTTTTTTTTPVVGGPIIIHAGDTEGGDQGDPAPPMRGSQTVINPPPSTTTTTLPPGPDLRLPANSGVGRRIVYSKSLQKVWVVEADGRLIKEHRVSGRQVSCDPTPGTYSVYSRSRHTFAIQNPSLVWGYMVRFAKGCRGGNIGFHEIPTDIRTGRKVQSVSQLGTPLSGGCVRQAESDAIWIWNWAGIGTKVVVLP